MPKNIVILLDGTSNEISSNRTNILRLFGALKRDEEQIVYYDPGVGTFGAEFAWSRLYRKAGEVWGLATGWGLDRNVKEAYRFLVENYDDGARAGADDEERDRIFIFGFSRGAYSARVLAGFIRAVGLMDRSQLNLLPYAYRAYKRIGEGAEDGDVDAAFAEVRLYESILDVDRPPIRLLGLFDTVSSMIEGGRFGPRLKRHAFTRNNHSVAAVRHAVAIDERRTMFRPQLWPEDGRFRSNPFNRDAETDQDVKEVWFRGVHADVGGGYPERGSGLAKVALKWMIDETAALGLRYKTATVNRIVLGEGERGADYDPPDPTAPPHQSMNFAWRVLEYLPQPGAPEGTGLFGWRLPREARRTIPEGARIHRAVFTRSDALGGDLPPNLPSDYVIEEG